MILWIFLSKKRLAISIKTEQIFYLLRCRNIFCEKFRRFDKTRGAGREMDMVAVAESMKHFLWKVSKFE